MSTSSGAPPPLAPKQSTTGTSSKYANNNNRLAGALVDEHGRTYHSVHDKQIAEAIMKRVGERDSRGLCTVERQIQERERERQKMAEVLRYSPLMQYMEDSESTPVDASSVHHSVTTNTAHDNSGGGGGATTTEPATTGRHAATSSSAQSHEVIMLKNKKKQDLSDADPSLTNIERKQKQAEESLKDRKVKMLTSPDHLMFRDINGHSALEWVEDELRKTYQNVSSRPVSATNTGGLVRLFGVGNNSNSNDDDSAKSLTSTKRANSNVKPKTRSFRKNSSSNNLKGGGGGEMSVGDMSVNNAQSVPDSQLMSFPPIPTVRMDSDQYSSTLMQLRKTKRLVDEHAANVSAVKSILMMQGSTDMKRTITRMFADPHKKDQISDEEYKRRDELYKMERQRNLEHQQALLKADKEALEKEMIHWTKGS
eukprot:PhF_6_TR19032/c0_g1_i1/m.27944